MRLSEIKNEVGLLVVQAMILAFLLWGGIGFDLPGTLGLTSEHAMILFAIYAMLFIYCAFRFVEKKTYPALAIQASLFVAALLIEFMG